MLVEKYKPKRLVEIVSQKIFIKKIIDWLKKWKPGKALLLYGPTGIGKTFISLLLTENRLNKFPDSKALVLTPTKPLSNQFKDVFKKHTNIPKIVGE